MAYPIISHDYLLTSEGMMSQKKKILESYLPAMLSREQTEALIDETIAKLWITDLKTQRWLLMKELMANHKSELDGAVVNDIINSRL